MITVMKKIRVLAYAKDTNPVIPAVTKTKTKKVLAYAKDTNPVITQLIGYKVGDGNNAIIIDAPLRKMDGSLKEFLDGILAPLGLKTLVSFKYMRKVSDETTLNSDYFKLDNTDIIVNEDTDISEENFLNFIRYINNLVENLILIDEIIEERVI